MINIKRRLLKLSGRGLIADNTLVVRHLASRGLEAMGASRTRFDDAFFLDLPLDLFVNLLELKHDLSLVIRLVDLPLDLVERPLFYGFVIVQIKLVLFLDIEHPVLDLLFRQTKQMHQGSKLVPTETHRSSLFGELSRTQALLEHLFIDQVYVKLSSDVVEDRLLGELFELPQSNLIVLLSILTAANQLLEDGPTRRWLVLLLKQIVHIYADVLLEAS